MSQDIGVYYFGGNKDCPIPKATESELGNLDVGGDLSGTVENALIDKISGDFNYALSATSDNIAYTLAVGITALVNGAIVAFKMPNHASGASCTLNVNSLGAKKLLRASDQSTQITTGDLVANGIYLAQYNTSLDTGSGAWVVIDTPNTANFAVTNSANSFAGAQVFAGTANFGETAGTAPTYTATLAITALVDGAWARLKIHSASTADDATLNVNSLGAKPIAKQSTGAQVTDINDLREKVIYDFVYSDDAISGGAWIALGI